MVLKTLFLGLLGFDFVLHQASAQYINHHQQYFLDPTDLYNEKVFDTKALTPVQIGKKGLLDWAFASTIDEPGGDLRALLVKLGPNFSTATPFQIEWAFQYFAGFGVSLDVEDVYYEDNVKDEGYVLCGKYTQEGESSGFLLRVDPQGTPITARVYNEISVFTSIVPWQNNKGYVAVGQFKEGKDNVKDAAFVSIKKKNLKVACALDMKGFFPRKALGFVEGQFNKVIQYKGGKSFAAVGDTTWQLGVAGEDNSKCGRNSDVLVAVVNKKCKVDFVNQYGDSTGGNGGETNERGLSIAQYSKKGGLVITGNTNQPVFEDLGCEKKNFDDTLAFRISPDGDTVEWMGQYSVSDGNLPDFGAAIQMSNSKKTPVLIAGEATTANFATNGLSKGTKDAFLLELDKKNGNVNSIDIFGLADDVDNGALVPGNLDLHLSQDGNAVIMGNARIENEEVSNPYLIERYETVQETCFDVRLKIEKLVYKFPMTNLTIVEKRKVKTEKLGVKELEFTLKQKIVCETTCWL